MSTFNLNYNNSGYCQQCILFTKLFPLYQFSVNLFLKVLCYLIHITSCSITSHSNHFFPVSLNHDSWGGVAIWGIISERGSLQESNLVWAASYRPYGNVRCYKCLIPNIVRNPLFLKFVSIREPLGWLCVAFCKFAHLVVAELWNSFFFVNGRIEYKNSPKNGL